MAEQNNQKLPQNNSALLPETGARQALSQNTIYEILSQGVIYTMEEDLKEAQRLSSTKVHLIPQQVKQEKPGVALKEPFSQKERLPQSEAVDVQKELAAKIQEKQAAVMFKPKPIEPLVAPPTVPFPPAEKQPAEKLADKPAEKIQQQEAVIRDVPLKSQPKEDFVFPIEQEEKNKLQQKVQTRKMEILRQLRIIPQEKKPLQDKRSGLGQVIVKEEALLSQLSGNDRELLDQFKAIEEQEAKASDGAQKHQLEQKRWATEEKRRIAQEGKWAKEEEIEKFHLTLGKIEGDLRQLGEKEAELQKEKEFCENMLDFLRLREEQATIKERLVKKAADGFGLAEKRDLFLQKKQDLTQKLAVIKQEEQNIELESKDLSQQEAQASNPQERRKWGQERWQAEERRKIQEKKRWTMEKDLSIIEGGLVVVEKSYQQLKEQADKIDIGIATLTPKFQGNPSLADFLSKTNVAEKPAPPVAPSQKQDTILQAKAEEENILRNAVKRQAQQQKREIDKDVQEQKDAQEKAKKLEQIRQQAEIEKTKQNKVLKGPIVKEEILKRLTKISPKEEADRQAFLDRVAGKKILTLQKKKELNQNVVFHPLIKRASGFKKFIVRIILGVIGVGVLVGGVWIIAGALKKPIIVTPLPTPSPSPEPIPIEVPTSTPTTTTIETPPQAELPTTTPVISPSIFGVDLSRIVDFQNPKEVGAFFAVDSPSLQGTERFERVVFVNNQTQEVSGLIEVLGTNGLDIVMPDGFFQQINQGDIFFYGAKAGTRFGIIAKINPSNSLALMMKNWEKGAFTSFQQALIKLNYSGASLSNVFRVSKTTPIFKYLTVSKQDLGICYLITDRYFVLTTSFEAMEKTIEKIKQVE